MTSSLEQSDKIAAEGATGKRVTLDSMRALIKHVDFWWPENSPTTTVCAATTKTGYTIIGKSGCADPANFDKDKGKYFAYEDVIRQMWPLEGYKLADEIYSAKLLA